MTGPGAPVPSFGAAAVVEQDEASGDSSFRFPSAVKRISYRTQMRTCGRNK